MKKTYGRLWKRHIFMDVRTDDQMFSATVQLRDHRDFPFEVRVREWDWELGLKQTPVYFASRREAEEYAEQLVWEEEQTKDDAEVLDGT
tara:strand:+ start:2560 stop:2826 length:267 start_codon:yes stop_codon:yes gene_type:complete